VVRPSQVSENREPRRLQLLMTWSPASRTFRFHFMVADAYALQVTEPSPVIKLEGDCLVLKILGRPIL
jgi:hypothetical protein